MLIVSRKTWGAKYRAGSGACSLPVPRVWLHHTVMTRPPADPAAEQAEMRRVEQVGQDRFGQGFSYTFAVAPSGRVYEGTGAGRVGAHTARQNSTSHAIVLLGDYSSVPMTTAQERAVADLLRHGRAQGWWTDAALTGGHRDAAGASTSCPGGAAHARIPTINALAAATVAPAPDAPEDEMSRYRAIRRVEDGAVALTAPGYFRHVSGEEWSAAQAAGTVGNPSSPDDVNAHEWNLVRLTALSSDRL